MMMRLNTIWLGLLITGFLVPAFGADKTPTSEGIEPAPGKSYQIRNKKYGDLLRPEEARSADGTPIVLYPAQAWKCMTWKLSSAGTEQFSLQNHFTSKTFAARGDNGQPAAVTQVPFGKNPADRPAWQFTKLKDGSFQIVDTKSGKALSAQKTPTRSDARIILEPWNESDTQKWELVEIDPAKLTM